MVDRQRNDGHGGEAQAIESIFIDAMERELEGRGLRPANGAKPDYWLGFVAAPTRELDAQRVTDRLGTFPRVFQA